VHVLDNAVGDCSSSVDSLKLFATLVRSACSRATNAETHAAPQLTASLIPAHDQFRKCVMPCPKNVLLAITETKITETKTPKQKLLNHFSRCRLQGGVVNGVRLYECRLQMAICCGSQTPISVSDGAALGSCEQKCAENSNCCEVLGSLAF
jgi:hypothetical protein